MYDSPVAYQPCPACGERRDARGECPALKSAMRVHARRNEPCGCYTCTVAGGDCALQGMRDDAPSFIRQHGLTPS